MATEYLECKVCRKKFASWSQHVLKQLEMGRRSHFPALLTYRYYNLQHLLLNPIEVLNNSFDRHRRCDQFLNKLMQQYFINTSIDSHAWTVKMNKK